MKHYISIFLFIFLISNTVFPCSMFRVTTNKQTFVCNNEDYSNPNTKMWYQPSKNGKYGAIYFGFDDLTPQGGINEAGLVFDFFGLSKPLNYDRDNNKKLLKDNNNKFICEVLQTCSTVEQALEKYEKYDLSYYFNTCQMMITDKTGNSAIIEARAIVRGKGNYQICTNFLQSEITNANDISCERYLKLKKSIENTEIFSIDSCKKMLHSVSSFSKWGGTLYSNIYDLSNGVIYLFSFHNYENVVSINVKEELTKGEQVIDIYSLFDKNEKEVSYRTNYNNSKKIIYSILEKDNYKNDSTFNLKINEIEQLQNEIGWISDDLYNVGFKFLYHFPDIDFLVRKKTIERAIALFRLYKKLYPNFYIPYECLGTAYYKDKQYEFALVQFKKVIELNSGNKDAQKMITKLDSKHNQSIN